MSPSSLHRLAQVLAAPAACVPSRSTMIRASSPYRAARHLFSRTNHGWIDGSSRPSSSSREKCSTSTCTSAATAASSGSVDIPSHARTSIVPQRGAGRMSHRTSVASAMTPVRTMSSR